ncbi:MAG TPA: glycosyltransferase family 39 protein [Kofleriaceae bacterium]|nr:glycosyltransferase family 39 protein [Kofleriaceae bacterium]
MTQQRLVGLGIAVLTFFVVMSNQREVGIARDETVYFSAGSRYAEWWDRAVTGKGINQKGITDYWGGIGGGNNAEHPSLVKTLMGASHKIFHDKLHILDELTAFRLPGALFAALVVFLVFSMTLAIWGFAEALLAAVCMLLLPRAIFHEGLACFDAPIMAMWFLTIFAYWKCLDGRRFPVEVGAAFGLALATKHNAVLLPLALGLHYMIVGWRAGQLRGLFLHRWRIIVSLIVLGPLVLFVLWPWLWLAPIQHTREWLAFHMHHVHYNFEYLGHNWNAPRFPWHVALVTTLFTVPVSTLAGALTGIGVWIGKWRAKSSPDPERMPALLLGISAAASMGPFFLGSTPIFGAEKHWMPALPTLCIAAGVGGIWAARQAARYLAFVRPMAEATAQKIAFALVAGTMVLAAATEAVDAQPYALTWYNSLAGGAPGGADRGMNRQFWGVSARGVLPFIQWMPPGSVYSHDASPAWGWYMRLGELSRAYPDSGGEFNGGIERSQYALVIHEMHFNRHDYLIWRSYGTVQPVFVLRSDGVPIVSVYKRTPQAR